MGETKTVQFKDPRAANNADTLRSILAGDHLDGSDFEGLDVREAGAADAPGPTGE